MADGDSLLLQRRRLRTDLRETRVKKGLTQDHVAKAMDWSLSKMIRIEQKGTISTNDLRALLGLYGLSDPETERLVDLARAARMRGWWDAYRGSAPESLLKLIEYETAASVVKQSETLYIPGILQTDAYARAVLEDYYFERPPVAENDDIDPIDAMIDLRVKRRSLLSQDNSPTFIFRIDEAAVRRIVGGRAVMRNQILSLIDTEHRFPHVSIEIMPFSAGLHPGMKGAFEIIEFPGDDSDIVYFEGLPASTISDDAEENAQYREAFERLEKTSLGVAKSSEFLTALAAELAENK